MLGAKLKKGDMTVMKAHQLICHFIVAAQLFVVCGCGMSDESIFSECLEHLVHITGNGHRGTGFVAKDDGREYVYTCEHCVLGRESITIRRSNGEILMPRKIYVAQDRDLVRFDFRHIDADGLPIAKANSMNLGDEIVAVGDSLGTGVMTVNSGKLLGIGATKIEFDAAVQHGNSGGPVMTRNGKVVGAVVSGEKRHDEFTEGTRFDKLRYFAVRVDNAQWKSLPYDEYVDEYAKLISMKGKLLLMSKYVHRLDVKQVQKEFLAVPKEEFAEYHIDDFLETYNNLAAEYRKVRDGNYSLTLYSNGVQCRYLWIKNHNEAFAKYKVDLAEWTRNLERDERRFNELCANEIKTLEKSLSETSGSYCGERDALRKAVKELKNKFAERKNCVE